MTVYSSAVDCPTAGNPRRLVVESTCFDTCANQDREPQKWRRWNSEPALIRASSECRVDSSDRKLYQYFSTADTAYVSDEYDNASYAGDSASPRNEMSIDSFDGNAAPDTAFMFSGMKSTSGKHPEGTKNATSSNAKTDVGFLQQYKPGERLGEGAFGVVMSCSLRSTGDEFAVKLVDTVENKFADVWQEAQMLRSLDHANIVKFHGIFTEKRFLCIVMDKFSGGDLIDGLQRYVGKHGQIPGQKIVGATRQMVSAIRYLHHSCVVHRDVKGDNVLMDRPGITDPALRIVLTDFGAARSVGCGERMSDAIGTFLFCPPEFFDRDYGAKADVWALGVVMFGLATGCYPFENENDVRNKRIVVPKTVYPALGDIISKMLERNEKRRLDSEQLMCHPYLLKGEETAVSSPCPMALRTDVVKDQSAKAGTPSRRSASKEPGSKGAKSKESMSRSLLAGVILMC